MTENESEGHERAERDRRRREEDEDIFAWHMGVLGENLAIGGALCASFNLGADEATTNYNLGDDFEAGLIGLAEFRAGCAKLWHPGCQRRAR